MCICINIYIYRYRKIDRFKCIFMHIYIYTHISPRKRVHTSGTLRSKKPLKRIYKTPTIPKRVFVNQGSTQNIREGG